MYKYEFDLFFHLHLLFTVKENGRYIKVKNPNSLCEDYS